MKTPLLLTALVLFSLGGVTQAGRYPAAGTQTFTFADGTTAFGDGSTLGSSFLGTFAKVSSNMLQISNRTYAGNFASFRIPNLDTGNAIQSFDASMNVRMSKSAAGSIPGAGWALSYGPVPTGNGSGDLGYTMAGGLVISFDTYADTTNDQPSIDVICNNTLVGSYNAKLLAETTPLTGGTFILTNPASGTSTSTISPTASNATVQSRMRSIAGWTTVVVTGSSGNWTVTNGVNGNFADPVGNGAALLGTAMAPGGGVVKIVNTQDGSPTTPEVWNITLEGRGFIYDATLRAVSVHWDYDGLDLSYNGAALFTNLPTPGFAPTSGNIFAFTASAVGGAQDTFIDDLVIETAPVSPPDTGGPVISEFMAENKDTLEDEDMETPDWIEIYNGQNVSVDLAGYQLTNGVATWTFPSVTLPAYGHLILYASGKNRTANPALLHTNFTLPKTGGVLSMLNPSNAVVSTWTYPNQYEDVSYGLKYQGGASGFLSPTSPGAPTLYSYLVAPEGPAEDVIWSREGGLISGMVTLAATAPLAPGAVIRYTTDNTVPTAASPILSGNLNVSASTNVRGRVFTPNHLPGPVSSRTFLMLDASLTNYNSSGQPFKSHLPLIVFDSFGVAVDATTDSAQPRPHRFTYAVVIDKDGTGYADITSPVVNFQGRGGTHVRGDSSSGFAQKSYAWETWNNDNEDKDAALLDFPAESDWALHGPYTDKTFIRNFLIYSKMRELHGGENGHAMRTRMVEVIYNQDPGQSVSYNDYRGVYILMERIKRNSGRVDIEKLTDLVTDPALITGGYIFRRDRFSADGNTALPVGMHSHTPNLLNAAQTNYLTNYLNDFNNALNGVNFADPALGYAPYIDVTSFIDNWWFVEIAKQIDGYRLSTYFTKSRAGKIKAAPLWDYNLSLGNADYATGDQYAGWYWNQTDSYWWARLRQDPNYELKNWDRYWEMRRGIFATSSIQAAMEDLKMAALNNSATPVTNNMALTTGEPSTNESAAQRHYRKYPILGTYVWPNAGGAPGSTATLTPRPWEINTTYQSEVDWMKTWLGQRLQWIDDQYFSGSIIYRPPNLSHSSGSLPLGTQVSISQYTGSAPVGYSYASGGTIYYSIDGSDPNAAGTVGVETALISGVSNPCKWLVPSATNGGFDLTSGAGEQQWTTYTDPPNIAQWTSANTGIGYDTSPDYLPLIGANGNTQSQMQGINATCYVRVNFTIPDQATLNQINTLRLSLKFEDGFRAYINGQQVAGSNDSHASMTGTPWFANAISARDEGAAVSFEVFDVSNNGIPALRVGTNVLAIHCLNGVDSTSSDLLMVPKLTWLPPMTGGGLVYNGPITLTQSATIKTRLLTNGVWSPVNVASYVVDAVPATAANIVISEIHYHPANPTQSEINAGFIDGNEFEFIELLNVSNQNVDLSDCTFANGITYAFGNVDVAKLTLAPGGRAIVVGNMDAFALRYGTNPAVKILGAYDGNLRNSGETVILLDATGGTIASVTYGTEEPWPVDADGPGYSLLLNNPSSGPNYNTPTAWRSSAQIGGSPGAANSVPFVGSLTDDTDFDGHNDFLEYAMGTSVANGNSVPQLLVSTVTDPIGAASGVYYLYEYTQNLAADGAMLVPEHSENLATWGSAEMVYQSTTNLGNGTAKVTWRSLAPVSAAPARNFVRVKASSVP